MSLHWLQTLLTKKQSLIKAFLITAHKNLDKYIRFTCLNKHSILNAKYILTITHTHTNTNTHIHTQTLKVRQHLQP